LLISIFVKLLIQSDLVPLIDEIIALPDTMSKEFAFMANNVVVPNYNSPKIPGEVDQKTIRRRHISAEQAFRSYRNDYLKKFFNQDLKLVLQKREKNIDAFRKRWKLNKQRITTQKEYDVWLSTIEQKLAKRKQQISYLEEEELHVLKGYKTVGIEFELLREDYPRIIRQGNSLEVVFDYELRKLMRRIDIDPDWWPVFRHYILSERIILTAVSHPNIEVTERLLFGPDNREIDHKISLNIGPNTRLNEIKYAWRFIVEPLQKKIKARWKGKNREKPTVKIALHMLNLANQGKSANKIMDLLHLNGDDWSETRVRKTIARARKWAEKRDSKKTP